MKYEATPYSGRVVLCTAADRHQELLRDYVTSWKDVLKGQLDVLILDGNHNTMFDPENVQPLIERLRDVLSGAAAGRALVDLGTPTMSKRASS